MKISICLPYMKKTITRQTILDWCSRIEQGPFHSLSCGERITGYTIEMRTTLAFAAAVTERVRIVPSLYVLPMHSAVWAAKEIATLDLLSNGRVTVTVGVGGREIDYKAVGAEFGKRHERQDEQIAIMKNIWAGNAPFDGADPVGPTPVQAGGPPILAGVMGPKAMARAAKWADGVYSFSMGGSAAETSGFFNMAEKAWQDAGRTTAPQKVGGFWYCLADGGEAKMKDYVYDYLKVLGDGIAKPVANSMKNFDKFAIKDTLAEMASTG
ncbi:MAG TPA: LLM class flavin-dependent oxidoreductase, partial [Pseudomonadales bacterium]|nr:LLM class flavin-dependent oxidoreductase [Pseudomonadales bacterium]